MSCPNNGFAALKVRFGYPEFTNATADCTDNCKLRLTDEIIQAEIDNRPTSAELAANRDSKAINTNLSLTYNFIKLCFIHD